jgi:hypothetical protein
MPNAIMIIQPYWYSGTWVFDDPATGLVREPFVAGVPEMINQLTRHIPNARNGFRLLFSGNEFPGYAAAFDFVRSESGDAWYRRRDSKPRMEGWLCPALFKYFNEAPPTIFAKAESIE